MSVHTIVWRPKARRFLDAHTYRMGLHEILWAVTQFRGCPVSGCLGRPKIGSPSRIYGPPHHCRWSPTFCGWTLTLMFGRPRNSGVRPQDYVGSHTQIVEAHIVMWAPRLCERSPTFMCGRPGNVCGLSRIYVGLQHIVGGLPRNERGWPRKKCGESRI